ncbi:phage portal protein, HK97 family [Sphingomonas laterariae]|uniref:Phage portal protein, HK97 family n=1 Tax=Edaphosphingomonas laterariae TaxID=861865 RepID=A0A239F9I6_9SPHN|nr:phage portal protein [Sphingomonas laterariae]SNS53411.1 phage portal protein, HK97 family [Sphingomonas laterariae]
MNLLVRATGLARKAAVWARRLSLRDPEGWRRTEGQSYAGEQVSETSVLALSTAWACINVLAGTIGSLPLMVHRTDRSGRRTIAKDHPLYRILHDSPNADQTALDFFEGLAASVELKGNAVAEITRAGDGRVISLTPMTWDETTVTRDRGGSLVYRWRDKTLSEDRVLHVRGFGGNPEGGLSTLAYGRNTFGLATAIDRSAGTMFANGVRPSGVLKFKEWLKPEQRQAAEDRMTQKFVGAMNAGRPLVLEGGVEWQQLTINPEDAQMLESRRFSVEDICRFFGVPPHMVGHTDKATSWGTGLEQQTLGFQKFTLRRRLKRIEMALEKRLLTAKDRADGITIEFSLEGLLRGDSAARSAFYASALQNGWMTINEVRELENLAPVAGGETPRMQSQNVPITAVPTALP